MELSWSLLTIGRLSMNKFWGEDERMRKPLCTSTLVRTPQGLLIVDPPLVPPEIPRLLGNQAGVSVDDVRHVFLTHFHGDHRFGLEAFPDVNWWMAEPEIEYWRERAGDDSRLLDSIRPAGRQFLPGIETLASPGHTPGTTALTFAWRGKTVAIAGDAAMTEEFFWAKEGFHNSVDFDQARESIETLSRTADLIVPGHGNVFATSTPPEDGGMWSGGREGLCG